MARHQVLQSRFIVMGHEAVQDLPVGHSPMVRRKSSGLAPSPIR
jgi:hypothetical protein